MSKKMSLSEAEQHLLDLAQKAEAVAGSHISGITFHHDDLRKLSTAIRLKLGQSTTLAE